MKSFNCKQYYYNLMKSLNCKRHYYNWGSPIIH